MSNYNLRYGVLSSKENPTTIFTSDPFPLSLNPKEGSSVAKRHRRNFYSVSRMSFPIEIPFSVHSKLLLGNRIKARIRSTSWKQKNLLFRPFNLRFVLWPANPASITAKHFFKQLMRPPHYLAKTVFTSNFGGFSIVFLTAHCSAERTTAS